MKNSLLLVVLVTTSLLAGCGHKGPLVMPPEAPQPPAAQAAPAPDAAK